MKGLIQDFMARKQHYFCEPVQVGNILRINSSDLINFLDQAEFGNEFDWFRFRAAGVRAIAALGSRKRDPLMVRQYRKCGEALEIIHDFN